MNMCIDSIQLKKALADIERAEKNGFKHCLAVMQMVSAGRMISDNILEYRDLLERAHPTDSRLDWGRFQLVTTKNRFVDGELVPLDADTSNPTSDPRPTSKGVNP